MGRTHSFILPRLFSAKEIAEITGTNAFTIYDYIHRNIREGKLKSRPAGTETAQK